MGEDFLISRRVFDAQQLMASHPPRWQHRNKKAVARISCSPESVHNGQLIFSRWQERPLPETHGNSVTVLEGRADAFQYAPPPPGRTVAWHLNFAHFDVFAFYGGGLFAQDEMQVTEHPALGALREALLTDAAVTPATVEAGRPTPVLVHGVERRCIVDTAPDPDQGRPDGLYGNHFAAAKAAVVEQATRALTPPTVSNILAIEAPSYGTGTYTRDALRLILRTAYAGFAAARQESQRLVDNAEVVVHTGFWGCGAYGGNRELMALLQILAARLARVDRLVFHALNARGVATFAAARATADRLPAGSLSAALTHIEALQFQWGVSDGN